MHAIKTVEALALCIALSLCCAVSRGGESVDADGTTALHWAVHVDDLARAQALLEAGARADATNQFGATPLALACTNGSAEMITLLLEAGASTDAAPSQEPPLNIAARTGKAGALRVLLAHGADPNTQDARRAQTALMWAAAEGHLEALRLLLESGAKTDARSEGGFTPLLFAVRQGHAEIVMHLLDAGAPVNDCLKSRGEGPSAVGLAVINAHWELAAYLLEAGADPDYTWQNRNALHTLTWVRRPGAGSNDPSPPGSGAMSSLELVEAFARHGADLDARVTASRTGVRTKSNFDGATAFFLAARTADAELMRLLAELGADPLIPNKDGTTPLMAAAGVGVQSPGEDPGTPAEVYEAVEAALEFGGNVNAVDTRGETVMHGVAYKYAASAVPLLVAHGADINVWNKKNKTGWTPLRIAVGVHRTMNLRSSPECAAALRKVMTAAGVSTEVEPETNISGATN